MSQEEEKELKKEIGVSRREFLKNAGIVAGGLGTAAFISSCSAKTVTETVAGTTKTVTPAAVTSTVIKTVTVEGKVPTVKLNINGQDYILNLGTGTDLEVNPQYDVYPWHTLLKTLREHFKLTGTKVSCDKGACAGCTVIMNGTPILACMTLTVDCNGQKITTIEGLSNKATDQPSSLQQAFIDNSAFQCGFCTPGMIMGAKALLAKNPNPTEADVKQALSGHFCRCISHYQVIKAVVAAVGKGG